MVEGKDSTSPRRITKADLEAIQWQLRKREDAYRSFITLQDIALKALEQRLIEIDIEDKERN
jgi:hypothetical protein